MYSLQLSRDVSTKWPTVAYLHIPDLMQLYLLLTWGLSGSKIHNLS
jgi:hypothetical protein